MTRIASFPHHNQVVNLALTAQETVMNRQVQVASGYKDRVYTGISADSQRVVNLESQISRSDAYIKNGETAKLRLDTMENAVASLTDLATNFRSLLIQATSGDQADELNLTQQAEGALQTVQTTLNTRLDGRYLFGGANTDEAPVDLSRLVTPTQAFTHNTFNSASSPMSVIGVNNAGQLNVNGQTFNYDPATDSINDLANAINQNAVLRGENVVAYVDQEADGTFRFMVEDQDGDSIAVTEVTAAGGDLAATLDLKEGVNLRPDVAYYQGDQQQLNTRLDDEFDLNYGVTADLDPFESLIRGLRTASATTDRESLNEALEAINEAIEGLPNIRSDIGVDLNSVQHFDSTHRDFKVFAEQAVTDIETVDVPESMALLAIEQTQLQASYITISRLSDLSLTQYLR